MTWENNGKTSPETDPAADSDSEWRQVIQQYYEPDETGDLTTALVFAIAEARDVSPSELKSPPLYDCIDAAALEETFFGSENRAGRHQGAGTIEFQYTDNLVSVTSDGWIEVYERADESAT